MTISVVMASVLGACSTLTNAQSTNQGTDPAATAVAQNEAHSLGQATGIGQKRRASQLSVRQEADLVYKILAAEFAGRRGRVDIAAENYYEAATVTDDPRVAERAAKLAMYSRDWVRADKAVDLWVQLTPASIEGWQHKAQIAMQRQDVEGTTTALERVVDLSEGEPSAVIPGVVNSVLRQADAELGSEVLSRLGQRFPDSADTQYGIGRFAMSRGNQETALAAFERALEIDPDNTDAVLARARLQLEMGVGDDALVPVEQYLQRNTDDVNGDLGFVRILVESGKYERATTQFESIATKYPSNADALFTIGLLALEIKRVKQAEDYLLKVVALGKHEADANYYLGRISDSRKDYRQAIDRYTMVEEGDNFFDAQIRAAELYGLVDEIDKGRELIANLRSISGEQAIQVELVSAESRLLNSNDLHSESLQLLTDALEKYEDDATLLYARALVAERLDQREVFEADLTKVIAAQPENGYALNALGYFLADRNERLDEAEGYLDRAYKLMPDDAAIVDSLGWLYYRQSKFEKSIELLRKAHSLLPDAEIAAHLGEVLWVSGDQDSATKVWEEALRDSPEHDLLNSTMKKYTR